MASSGRSFRESLYEEHLEEASFIFAQGQALRARPGFEWTALAELEARLEAHLDALVVGADLALTVCSARAESGDAGELFAAIVVFCRQRQAPLVADALQNLAPGDTTRHTAVAQALKDNIRLEWAEFAGRALSNAKPELVAILGAVCGYRRMAASALIERAAQHHDGPHFGIPLSWAMGRIEDARTRPVLEHRVTACDAPGKHAALLALARMGVAAQELGIDSASPMSSWSHIVFALSADRQAGSMIAGVVRSGRIHALSLLALGLLGDASNVQLLQQCLVEPSVAKHAATALNWLTGADLFEEAFIPDEVIESELFDHELAQWRERREAPKRVDGKPFGDVVRKLTTDVNAWATWWTTHRARFLEGRCYRRGRLHGPAALLQDLNDPRTDQQLRSFTAEEVVIRYGCKIPFEIDMPVTNQRAALDEIGRWAEANEHRFSHGGWYFGGRSWSA